MAQKKYIRYGMAPIAVGLMLLCRLALNPVLHDASPFMYFFIAIIVSAWLGGLGSGITATILSTLAVDYYYLPPIQSIFLGERKEITQEISFLILGVVVSAIVARMRFEQRRAEQARRAQEKEKDLLQSVMNGTRNSHLVYLDRDFNFVRVNEAYATTCGYKPEEMVGKNHFALYPHEENEAIFARVRDTGEPAEFHDKPFVFPDQPERGVTYWDWTLNPIKDGSGNVEGLVFSLVETTERKRAEMALRESETRYRSLFENMLEGYAYCRMIFDDQGRPEDFVYLRVNDAFERLTGLKDVADKRVGDVIPGVREAHPELFEIYGRVAATGQPEKFEIEFKPLGIWFSISVYSPGRGTFVAVFDNITGRKKAEESLRASEERWATTLASIGDAVIATDIHGGITFMNAVAEGLTGWSLAEAQTRPVTGVFDIVNETTRAKVEDPVSKVLREGKVVGLANHTVLLGKDGSEVPIDDSGAPIRDRDGKIMGVVLVFRDITERKLAEKEIFETTQRLEAVMKAVPVGVSFSDDPTCLRITGNPAVLAQFEWQSEDNISASAPDPAAPGRLVHFFREGRLISDAELPLQRAVAENQPIPPMELLVELPSGRRWFCDASGAPIRDAQGNVIGGVAVTVDITERKRTEDLLASDNAALARLHELSARLIGENDLGILLQIIIDAAVELTSAHRGMFQLYDRDTQSLRIVSHWGLQLPFLDYFATIHEGPSVCIEAFRRRERVVVENVAQSRIYLGSPAMAIMEAEGIRAAQSTPMIAHNGEILGLITTHWTEPHRPDERSLRLLDLLAREAADLIELRQREEALERANAELMESDRRKNEFLAMLAHELRNPLAPVRYAVQLMNAYCDADCPSQERIRRQREIIERHIGQMAHLIDDLLDVARIARGKIELRKELTSLDAVLRQSIDSYRQPLERKQQELIVSLSEEPLWMEGDSTRLSQVFHNLLDNASKYSPANRRIWVDAEREPGKNVAIVRVRDEGFGISEELLPHVFEPFTQGERGLDRAQGGLGIGLTMVQRLIRMHGGTIEARSGGRDQGSEFVVRLPLIQEAEQTKPTPGEMPPPAGGPLKILAVDDVVDTAQSLTELLGLFGHQARAAFAGLEALEIAQSWRPDVVLLDVGMPGMDGYEVARRLRAEYGRENMRIIALTGYGQETDREEACKAGFDDLLVKPVDLDALRRVLERTK